MSQSLVPTPRDDEPSRSLRHSVREGCAHAVMLGAGEAYLPPFAIALGASSVHLGLLASLPLFVGALSQIASVRLLDRVPHRKTLVLVPAVVQAVSWIPLLVVPWVFFEHAPLLVLVCAVPYFALGSFGLPPWSSWMGDLVPPLERGHYFGRRDRLRTLCQLTALVAGGIVLNFTGDGRTLWGFAVVFVGAAFARFASARELSSMVEPPFTRPSREDRLSIAGFVREIPGTNFGRFALFVACMQLATNVAGPFFSLYMLRDLGFSYGQFTTASAVCISAQALAFHNWGRIGDQLGNFAVLRLTGFLLPVIPLLWLISPRFEAVLVYQAISGFVWAGFNLSAANFIFDSVPPPRRPRSIAYYQVMINGGILIGCNLGGWVAPFAPSTLSIGAWELDLTSKLQALFLLSGAVRLLVALCFLPLLREVRTVERTSSWKVLINVVGLQPIRGMRFSIFGGVHPSERRRGAESTESTEEEAEPKR